MSLDLKLVILIGAAVCLISIVALVVALIVSASRKRKAKKAEVVEEKVSEEKAVEAKPAPAKKAEKTEAVKEEVVAENKEEVIEKDEKASNYLVQQNQDTKSEHYKSWGVKKEGSQKTIKYLNTQKEAIVFADELAKNAGTSVVVYKVDGTIRK